jgi:hypothetical protein
MPAGLPATRVIYQSAPGQLHSINDQGRMLGTAVSRRLQSAQGWTMIAVPNRSQESAPQAENVSGSGEFYFFGGLQLLHRSESMH